jgi:hypothetical protein
MSFPNITQATYDRLTERCESGEQQTNLDVSDLLEAYESAVLLLDKAFVEGWGRAEYDAAEFLNTETGHPRVDLWEKE